MTAVAATWGSTRSEREQALPCDRLLPEPDGTYHRAVAVRAPAPVVFRWLCQLRVAPYSYDLIDNFGRRSPRALTLGLDDLATGQSFMTIFSLAEFERDSHVTLVLTRARWMFGACAVTYALQPAGASGCRLVVRVLVKHPGGRAGARFLRPLLPWLDLVMMRRQLLNLKKLSERE